MVALPPFAGAGAATNGANCKSMTRNVLFVPSQDAPCSGHANGINFARPGGNSRITRSAP
jgi:hypothetical protein